MAKKKKIDLKKLPGVTKKSNYRFTQDPNDPALKAYQDSLNVYNTVWDAAGKIGDELSRGYYLDDLKYDKAWEARGNVVSSPAKLSGYEYKNQLQTPIKTLKSQSEFGDVLPWDEGIENIDGLNEYYNALIKHSKANLETGEDNVYGGGMAYSTPIGDRAYIEHLPKFQKALRSGLKPTHYLASAELPPVPIFKKPTSPIMYISPGRTGIPTHDLNIQQDHIPEQNVQRLPELNAKAGYKTQRYNTSNISGSSYNSPYIQWTDPDSGELMDIKASSKQWQKLKREGKTFENGGQVMTKNSKKLSKDYWGISTSGDPFNYDDSGIPLIKSLYKKRDEFGRKNLMHPNAFSGAILNKRKLADHYKKAGKPEKAATYEEGAERLDSMIRRLPKLGNRFAQVDAITYKNGGKLKKMNIGGQMPPVPQEAYGTPITTPTINSSVVPQEDMGIGMLQDAVGGISGGPVGMFASAVGGLVTKHFAQQEADKASRKARVSNFNANLASNINLNDPTRINSGYAMALNGKDLSDRVSMTEYNGNTHEQGGLPLPGLDVEVEGGETRTGDMVHSDNLIVTPELLKMFPNVFKKGDKGKTMAQVSKRVQKKFDRRKNDEWNDQAALAALEPIEDVSRQLSTLDTTNPDTMLPQAEDGIDLLGYSPLIAEGVNLAANLIRQPEEVDYPEMGFTPGKATLRSVDPSIARIRTIFGNAQRRLRRYNPSGALGREAELAATEAEAVGQAAGQVDESNVQALNAMERLNAQLRARKEYTDATMGAQEEEANAANRMARINAITADVANLGTMAGQIGRDKRLMTEQERSTRANEGLMNRMLTEMYGEQPQPVVESPSSTLVDNPLMPDTQAEEDMYSGMITLPNVETYRLQNGGSLSHKLRLRKFKTF